MSIKETNNSQGNILVVDDTPANLRVLTQMLTEHGYKVRPVPNGKIALGAIEALAPDLILLDINMPEMDGYTLCETLKSNPTTQHIPVIFISALDQIEDKVKAFRVGGVDYIAKPFQLEEVLARVKTHLTLSQLQANLETKVTQRTEELHSLNQAYERFVPREFLSQLDKDCITDVELGHHIHQQMTVMLSDIKRFALLSKTMQPAENFDFINNYLAQLNPIIRQHQGYIDTYMGDGVMSLFPHSSDDALDAIIAIQYALADFNQQRATKNQPIIHRGSGIHTGDVMLGVIGETERLQGTIISDVVKYAGRLEELTRLYHADTLVSKAVIQHLSKPYSHRYVDSVRIQGSSKKMAVYEILEGDYNDDIQHKRDTLDQFNQAIQHYKDEDLTTAGTLFKQIAIHSPDDKVTQLYIKRCENYQLYDPPSE